MKSILGLALLGSLLLTTGGTRAGAAQEPQDFEILIQLRAEEAERERHLKELKETAEEISILSKVLSDEVALADGYTTSVKLVDATNKIEDLADKMKDLAKTVRNRAQGH